MTDTQPTTREESLKGLEVVGGRIITPGMFLGAAVYVPFFWEKALDGWQDEEDEDGGMVFYIMPDDRKIWPELGHKKLICIMADENGAVLEVPCKAASYDG